MNHILELVGLHKQLDEVSNFTSIDALEIYYEEFDRVSQRLSLKNDPTVQAALVFLLLDLNQLCLRYYDDTRVPDYVICGFPSLFKTPGTIEKVREHAYYTQFLAFICMENAYETLSIEPIAPLAELKEMLSIWMGRPVTDEEAHSHIEVTNLLYGEGTYQKYRNAVEDARDLPAHLFCLHTCEWYAKLSKR